MLVGSILNIVGALTRYAHRTTFCSADRLSITSPVCKAHL